jgi:hypothetical protein
MIYSRRSSWELTESFIQEKVLNQREHFLQLLNVPGEWSFGVKNGQEVVGCHLTNKTEYLIIAIILKTHPTDGPGSRSVRTEAMCPGETTANGNKLLADHSQIRAPIGQLWTNWAGRTPTDE